jgi:hypothetical protein
MPAWLWATAAAALVVAVAVPVLAFARRGGVPPDGTAAAPRPSVSVVTRTPSPSAEPSTARRARPTAGKRPGPQVAPARRAEPASTPAPAPPSAAPQVRQLPPQKYDICAQEASVRRDPLPEDQTRTVATMRRGDTFTVTAAKGNVWVYGQAGGSVSATGWAFRTYMQSGCS